MSQIYQAMLLNLSKKEYRIHREDKLETLSFGTAGRNGCWRVIVHARQKIRQLVIIIPVESNCPANKRSSMCKFLTQANNRLITGCFDMNMRSGEVRYKTSILLEDQPLNDSLIEPMLRCALRNMDQYYPGLMRMMFGDGNVRAAITDCRYLTNKKPAIENGDEESTEFSARQTESNNREGSENPGECVDPEIIKMRKELAEALSNEEPDKPE